VIDKLRGFAFNLGGSSFISFSCLLGSTHNSSQAGFSFQGYLRSGVFYLFKYYEFQRKCLRMGQAGMSKKSIFRVVHLMR